MADDASLNDLIAKALARFPEDGGDFAGICQRLADAAYALGQEKMRKRAARMAKLCIDALELETK